MKIWNGMYFVDVGTNRLITDDMCNDLSGLIAGWKVDPSWPRGESYPKTWKFGEIRREGPAAKTTEVPRLHLARTPL